MRELLLNDEFRAMMRRRPRLPENLMRPDMAPPWHLWVLTTSDKWKRGKFRTYDDAYKKMRELLKDESIEDVSITSIRYMMPPPMGFVWMDRKYPWCARCRRPSTFVLQVHHRAINFEEPTLDEPNRCFYCGIRLVALPRYSPR
jgi:DNA-directed RNA polymerase subunit RPC12/RpoP